MRTVIESVPNISEGRDRARVEEIAAAVRAVPGTRLLGVSSDSSHNRSVLTLVGDAAGVAAAIRALFEAALPRIDLTKHSGEHPRMESHSFFSSRSRFRSSTPSSFCCGSRSSAFPQSPTARSRPRRLS